MRNDNMKTNWSKHKDVVNTPYRLSSLIPPTVKPSEPTYTGMQLNKRDAHNNNRIANLCMKRGFRGT